MPPLRAEPLDLEIPESRRPFDLRLLGLAGIQSWGVAEEQAYVAAAAVANAAAGWLGMTAVPAGSTSRTDAAGAGLSTVKGVAQRLRPVTRGSRCWSKLRSVQNWRIEAVRKPASRD